MLFVDLHQIVSFSSKGIVEVFVLGPILIEFVHGLDSLKTFLTMFVKHLLLLPSAFLLVLLEYLLLVGILLLQGLQVLLVQAVQPVLPFFFFVLLGEQSILQMQVLFLLHVLLQVLFLYIVDFLTLVLFVSNLFLFAQNVVLPRIHE